MPSDSQLCVDQLLAHLVQLDKLIDANQPNQISQPEYSEQLKQAQLLTQTFVENNTTLIPPYCMKKATDALRKAQNILDEDQRKSSSNFKFNLSAVGSKTTKPANVSENSQQSQPKTVAEPKRQITQLPFNGIQNKSGETVNLDTPSLVDSQDISLINLRNCHVNIVGLANTVYISDLQDTQVTVVLARRAITVKNCINCQFKLVYQQLRIDSCRSCEFEIFSSARSMLESSNGLKFAKLNLDTLPNNLGPTAVELFNKASLDVSKNNWKCIDDFDWLVPGRQSKNYTTFET